MAEYGGLQATDEGGVKYVLQDWQGSTRTVVGNTGNIQSREDFTAFGEPIDSETGLRTATQGKTWPRSIAQDFKSERWLKDRLLPERERLFCFQLMASSKNAAPAAGMPVRERSINALSVGRLRYLLLCALIIVVR